VGINYCNLINKNLQEIKIKPIVPIMKTLLLKKQT